MAIQPIDLQTVFIQVEKIGKEQASLREGASLHQAMLGEQAQRKLEEQIKTVNKVQDTGQGIESIKDRGARHEKREKPEEKHTPKEAAKPYQAGKPVFKDPALGKNVDFSG
ncbi:MAG: hypothetical protein LBO67_04225 [Spirochaetaceae bacterium]|jgi:hypothetical protein|nr:hypothetical protein [Spirochaetaceae bacterium]